MPLESSATPLPPSATKEDGEVRRIGVELEFSGIDVPTAAGIVANTRDGKMEMLSPYEAEVRGDANGQWRVELDYQWLKDQADASEPEGEVSKFLGDAAERIVRTGAELLVPVEVVSPPLPMDRLYEIQPLIDRLREAGAVGTSDSIVYAFGLQLNPELPDLSAHSIRSYLQAFLCMQEWLQKRSRIDATRRLTTYVEPFSRRYRERVLASDYEPGLDQLIEDYLQHNPTRNRALDMLPLFSHLDAERVRKAVDDPRIKSRPTLHYRLPNCEIDRADWGIRNAWEDWLQVERLAVDPDRLKEVCARCRAYLRNPLRRIFGDWSREVEQWLK